MASRHLIEPPRLTGWRADKDARRWLAFKLPTPHALSGALPRVAEFLDIFDTPLDKNEEG